MTAGRAASDNPAPAFAEPHQVCRKSVEFGAREIRERERDDARGVARELGKVMDWRRIRTGVQRRFTVRLGQRRRGLADQVSRRRTIPAS
jgi:hypothetical protein